MGVRYFMNSRNVEQRSELTPANRIHIDLILRESGGSLHPCSPPGLAAELRPPGREQLEGRSFVASSSICLLPPPQEALQCKTSKRKYYSCRRAQ